MFQTLRNLFGTNEIQTRPAATPATCERLEGREMFSASQFWANESVLYGLYATHRIPTQREFMFLTAFNYYTNVANQPAPVAASTAATSLGLTGHDIAEISSSMASAHLNYLVMSPLYDAPG